MAESQNDAGSRKGVALILLPGLDGSGVLFEPFIAALNDRFEIRVVSYPPDEVLDYAGLEQFARRRLPEDGEFVILGESFSGPVAIAIAAHASDRLIGVILSCTFAKNPRPGLSWLWMFNRLMPISKAPGPLLKHVLIGRFESQSLLDAVLRVLAPLKPAVLRARVRAVITSNVFSSVAKIPVPILYLQADNDRIVPASAGLAIASASSMVRMASINGPHLLLQTAPDKSAAAVSEFIDACAREPRRAA